MAKDTDHQYTPLLADSESLDDRTREKHANEPLSSTHSAVTPHAHRSRVCLIIAVVGEACLIAFLAGMLWKQGDTSGGPLNRYPQTLYSPAQEAIENVYKVFSMGFGKTKSIYQAEPSPEVDQAWLDLYNSFGLSKIPKDQARLLPNKTLPIPGDEEYYAVGLSVFHQLHCLNIIRKGLRADYYADPLTGAISGILPEDWPDHVSHCLENLRQSVMCASDISLIVWQWVEEANVAAISMDTIHSCRDFDRIVDWAKAHERATSFNVHVHIEDDIVIPLIL